MFLGAKVRQFLIPHNTNCMLFAYHKHGISLKSKPESEVDLCISLPVVYLCISIVSIKILAIIHKEIEQEAVKTVADGQTPVVVEHKATTTVIHSVVIMGIIIAPARVCGCGDGCVCAIVVRVLVYQMIPNGNHGNH